MILVVDDDEAFLEQAQEILNRNRQVFLASDADRAFELVRELGFSVVLVDLDLPGEDGFALIRKLRDTVPELSIIVVNSALHSLTLEDARKLGAVEVLKKPITSDWKPVVERVRQRRSKA
jgi:two-component system phosphate regulon sensor histidine kinase PhoR